MNVYAESSAVLAWLLGEESGRSVRQVLQHSELVMASDLTLVECDRVLIGAVRTGEIDEAVAADRRAIRVWPPRRLLIESAVSKVAGRAMPFDPWQVRRQ